MLQRAGEFTPAQPTKNHMITVELDKEITFDLPTGSFNAEIAQLKKFTKQTEKGKEEWLRIIFKVDIKELPNLECRAGKNFQLSFKPGSDLRNFLAPILGPEFFKNNSAQKLDLEKELMGKAGVVSLSHFVGESNGKPFVVVDSFEPAPSPAPSPAIEAQPNKESK